VHLTDLELLHYYANRLAGRDLDRRDTSGS